MNGRIYDFNVGRFLSVDPFLQFPENSQSANPYSYILNNPMSGTDPTGYAATGGGCSTGSNTGFEGFCTSVQLADTESKKKSKATVGNGEANGKLTISGEAKRVGEVGIQLEKSGGKLVSGQTNLDGSATATYSFGGGSSGVGGYTDGELAKMGFSAGTRFINDFGDWRARPGGVSIEQDQAALADAAGVAGFAGAVLLTGGALTAYIGAEATGLVFIAASGGDMVDVALARLPVVNKVNYSSIKNPPSIGPGKDFTLRQKMEALELNKVANGGVVKSDLSGTTLVQPQKSQRGVIPDRNEWQFDHKTSKNCGGTNCSSNLQILSREENRAKWDK